MRRWFGWVKGPALYTCLAICTRRYWGLVYTYMLRRPAHLISIQLRARNTDLCILKQNRWRKSSYREAGANWHGSGNFWSCLQCYYLGCPCRSFISGLVPNKLLSFWCKMTWVLPKVQFLCLYGPELQPCFYELMLDIQLLFISIPYTGKAMCFLLMWLNSVENISNELYKLIYMNWTSARYLSEYNINSKQVMATLTAIWWNALKTFDVA